MKFESSQKILVLLLATSLLSACGKKNQQDDEVHAASIVVDPVEASIESGMTMVSGLADDEAGSSYAQISSFQKTSVWQILFGDSAQADACGRAYFQACGNGVKAISYEACSVPGTSRLISGDVQLAYSHMSCSLATNGDNVIRTYDLAIAGPRGGEITHQSAVASDYRGSQYGGGGRLTKTVSGWEIDVLGRHTRLTFRNRQIFDVSVRTLQPLQVSGSINRSGRVVSSGQLEVNHNLARFTSVMTPSNLTWSNSCCHPVSGSLNLQFSGSKSGSANVTFQGCGSASVDEGGQSKSIALSYCD